MCGFVFSQGEASHWYFGNGAGLAFDVDSGTVSTDNSAENTIATNEGCSSISDTNGNLLFYTDGRTVWGANHQIMPNADYFGGNGLLGDPSSTSSGVIVPKPGNNDQYYIFTVDEPHHNNAWAFPNQGPADQNGDPINAYVETFGSGSIPQDDDGFNNGFNYSLVDLSLNGGFGDVVDTEKNVHLITYDETDQSQAALKCAEKITAVYGDDCVSIWVITQFVDTFYAFRVDENGVNHTPVTSVLEPFITTEGYRRNGIGYMKASPDGTKVAIAHSQNLNTPSDTTSSGTTGSVWLYDFDSATGIVSNPTNIISNLSSYGLDFSADSKKLYTSNSNTVSQFDLEVVNISASQTIVHQSNGFVAAIQLGPNGKIYICNTSSNQTLDVINNPEELGTACNYEPNGITLSTSTNANLGLPPFISSFFLERINIIDDNEETITTELSLCEDESYTLIADDIPDAVYVWTQDGNILAEDDFDLIITEPGFYRVSISNISNQCNGQIIGEALISYYERPQANQPQDIVICDDNNDSSFSFDFTTNITDQVIGTQDVTTVNVRYFTSIDDATNDENEIMMPYETVSNPQEIFVRIENIDGIDCFEITSFLITLFDTPTANQIDDVEICDDALDGDDTNGIVTTNLEDIEQSILGSQSNAILTVTFHSSQEDADLGINAFPSNYQNTVPFLEIIFARVENDNNTDCFDTTSFNLVINPAPEAFNTSLFQCDEDGVPDGFTLFNLTEANDALTGETEDRSTKFFTSLIDAQNSENEIDGNAFSNWESPQTIYVQVINDITSCFSIAELTLEVSTTNASDTEITECDYDGIEDGFHSFTLSDANIGVLNGFTEYITIFYYKTYEDALLEQSPLSNTYTNTTPYSQTIFVRVESINNYCYGINEVQLTVFELPNIETEEELLYCLNFFPDLITLTGGIIDDSPNNYFYDWSTGEDTSEIQVNEPGTYTVTVTNTDGCSKVRTITVVPSNIATIESIDVIDATSNNTITINVSGEGDYEFALNDINGPYQDSNFFENVEPGFHTVYVRDKNGCGIVEDIVSVIGFPKFFTPNGDGVNDTWQVYGINNSFQISSKIFIFDRFGKLLTQLSHESRGWDGMYNGNHMPSSDYWFHVTLGDGRVFTSHFALKR